MKRKTQDLKTIVFWGTASYVTIAGVLLSLTAILDQSSLLEAVKIACIAPIVLAGFAVPVLAIFLAASIFAQAAKAVFLLDITDKGLDIYHRPKGRWKRLAIQQRPSALHFCLASPTIEWEKHLYQEVVYLDFIHISDLDIDQCQLVVLRDGEMVEDQFSAAQRIAWLTSVLSSSQSATIDNPMDKRIITIESILGSIHISEQADWHRAQQGILGRYIPEHTWASFLHILEQTEEAIHRREEWYAKTVRVLQVISPEPISDDLIEALDWAREQTERYSVEGARKFLACVELLEESYQALLRDRHVWARDRTAISTCKTALGRWPTLFAASKEIKEQLDLAEYFDTVFDQARIASFQKVVAKKLASYRIPLDRTVHQDDELSKRLLTEEKLDQLVKSLPSR